jgi:hypothetical protein
MSWQSTAKTLSKIEFMFLEQVDEQAHVVIRNTKRADTHHKSALKHFQRKRHLLIKIKSLENQICKITAGYYAQTSFKYKSQMLL